MHQSGRCSFALVSVEVEPADCGVAVDCSPHLKTQTPNPNSNCDPTWIRSALTAAKQCAERLVAEGFIAGCKIQVVEVTGTYIDTTNDAIAYAATAAVWKGLVLKRPPPEAKWNDGGWVPDWQ